MRKILVIPVLAFLLMLSAVTLQAQEITVSGVVQDARDGSPLPGATIRVKENRSLGTTANAKGEFRLVIAAEQATLVVRYVGYKARETAVTSSVEKLVIKLSEDILKTEEVIVTGIATDVKRENAPNAIGVISADQLLPAPAQTTDQALVGKVAGLTINQNTGAPGGGININLRGVTTLIGNSQPLIIVDGVISSNDQIQSGLDVFTEATGVGSRSPQGQPTNRLADLNPNDIADIQILKGPSAAAVYGAKAAAGVILITTKKGRAGDKTTIEFSQQFGMNTILRKQGTRNWQADSSGWSFFGTPAQYSAISGIPFIDYEDELYGQNGLINETSVSVRGGNANTLFFLSGTARNENGIIRNTGFTRYNTRLNVSHRLAETIMLDAGLGYSNSLSNRGATGNSNNNLSLGYVLAFTPGYVDVRGRNPDGTYKDPLQNGTNPFEIIDRFVNTEKVNRVTASGKLDWDLFRGSVQSLKFIAQGGVDYFTQENTLFAPPDMINEVALGSQLAGRLGRSSTPTLYNNLYLNLLHTVQTSNVSFKTSGGLQIENRRIDNVFALTRATSESQNINQVLISQPFQNFQRQYDQGLYAQEDIDISGIAFLTGGFRFDRSSANGDPNQWYFFPKAGGSLLLSKMKFWEGLRRGIESAKIRAAYGQAGNVPPPFAKFKTLATNNIGGNLGLAQPATDGNSAIEPERVTELEIGTDIGLAGGFASLEFTYFQRNISGLIVQTNFPPSSGFTSQFVNGGAMKTSGLEVALDLNLVRSEKFSWSLRTNFTRPRAEITELSVPAFQTGGFGTSLGAFTIRQGFSPTTIVGSQSFTSGQFNGTVVGDAQPDFRMGFANTFKFSGLELYFLWDWKRGGDVINLTRFLTDLGGTTADIGQASFAQRVADRRAGVTPWVEDGSFIKLRELSLTYTLNRETTQKMFGGLFSYLKIGVTGRNLLVFTDYSGYDPEVSNFGNVAIGGSVDVTPFPSTRSFYGTLSFGL
jgi:TonB-dependent starch-binding outer membrane protein SusC